MEMNYRRKRRKEVRRLKFYQQGGKSNAVAVAVAVAER